MSRARHRDLSAFEELTAVGATWEDRLSLIRTTFDRIDGFDPADGWSEVLRVDIETMGAIIRDLLKSGLKKRGVSGPRKSPDLQAGMAELRSLFGLDFSMMSFADTLTLLADGETQTTTAKRTGLSNTRVRKLLRGEELPTVWEIVQISNAYGKRPAFFADYRTLFVASRVAVELDRNPEWCLSLYKEMRGQRL